MNQPPLHNDSLLSKDPATVSGQVIEVYGFLNSAIGLGETARLLVRALRAVGCAVRPVAIPLEGRGHIPFTREELPACRPSADASIRILHVNPEHISELQLLVPEDFFTSARIVVIPYWETESIPAASRAFAGYFDEVWCATRFLADAFGKGFGLPLRHFPAPLAIHDFSALECGENFRFEDRYVFLFSFDYYSCFKRKNPDGLCEAFTRAFPVQEPGGPLLVVKSVHAEQHFMQDMYLKLRFNDRKDIIFIDGFLDDGQRAELFHRCNAYVSLHRSEGLGMTLLEAMVHGKPCIATAYSGNLDFTLPDHSYPVAFIKSRIGPGSIHYPPEDQWAEPDLDAAARAMRDCFMNPDESVAKGARAREWVVTRHHFEPVGKILLEWIRDLLARPQDAAAKKRRFDEAVASNPQAPGNRSAGAYNLLKQARERIKDTESMLATVPRSQKPLGDACRQLAHANKLLASAISSVIKMQKNTAAAHARELGIERHYNKLVMEVILRHLRG